MVAVAGEGVVGAVDAFGDAEAVASGVEALLDLGAEAVGSATGSAPLVQLVVAKTSSTVDQVRFLMSHPYPLASSPCL